MSMVRDEISRVISNTAYQAYERKLERSVMSEEVPHHVAIIMDGNRRYARSFGWSVGEGHTRGKEKLEEVMQWCMDLGIRILTVFAFSTENFNRDEDEVEHLMHLFDENFRALGDDERVHRNRIKVKVMGRRDLMSPEVVEAIEYAEERTKDYDEYCYNIAVAYGGREEIVNAVRQIAKKVEEGGIKIDDIDEQLISAHMYTANMPDPDLVLRTSGEVRVSNFLLWQMAYSELYFADVFWPGFRRIDFLRAIRSCQQRRRRYGM